MKIHTTLIAFMLSSLVVQGAGLVWPTETKGIFVKNFGPPIETVKTPAGFTVTPADVYAMFAPRTFTIMIYADDIHYVVTRYSRKQTLKQAQLFGATINGKTGAVEKPGLGLKVLKTYDTIKKGAESSVKEPSRSDVPQPGVKLAGKMYPLLCEGPELTDAETRLVARDVEFLLSTVEEPGFLKLGGEDGGAAPLKTDGSDRPVTHFLQLADSQRQWLPPILQQCLGPAVEIDGRYDLVIHRRVTEAYKNILSQHQPWGDLIKKLDAFMAALLEPAKRKAIANDPQKARDMFFFYKMGPWEDELMFRNVLLLRDNDADDVTMRRPSLLEFKTMDKLLYVEDADIAEIPACFLLTLVGDHQPYIERWPPLVYVDGKWFILIFPMP